MKSIRIGIVGVGNCASALIQGIHYYRQKSREAAGGLMHWDIRGYKPYDIEVVAALDAKGGVRERQGRSKIVTPGL